MKKTSVLSLLALVLAACHSRTFTSDVKDTTIIDDQSIVGQTDQRYFRYWVDGRYLIRGFCKTLPSNRTNCPEVARVEFSEFKTEADAQFIFDKNTLGATFLQKMLDMLDKVQQSKPLSTEKNKQLEDKRKKIFAGQSLINELIKNQVTYQKLMKQLVSDAQSQENTFKFSLRDRIGDINEDETQKLNTAYLFHALFSKMYLEKNKTNLTLKQYFDAGLPLTLYLSGIFKPAHYSLSSKSTQSNALSEPFCRAHLTNAKEGSSYETVWLDEQFISGPKVTNESMSLFVLTDAKLSFVLQTLGIQLDTKGNPVEAALKVSVLCGNKRDKKLMYSDMVTMQGDLKFRQEPLLLLLVNLLAEEMSKETQQTQP